MFSPIVSPVVPCHLMKTPDLQDDPQLSSQLLFATSGPLWQALSLVLRALFLLYGMPVTHLPV